MSKSLLKVILFATFLVPGSFPVHAGAVESYGLVFGIDGAHGGAFHDFAVNGFNGQTVLPNIKKYFIDQGVWVEHATTIFPTITGAALPSVLTGCYPGKHDLPSLYFFDRVTKQYPVLYVLLESFDWDKWLSPKVKTIWEYFEGPSDAISFGTAPHRGSDSHVSILWGFKYTPLELRAKMQLAIRDLKRKAMGGLPARLTLAYNGWFDHKEHGYGARGSEMLEHYKQIDHQVGEAIEAFNEMLEERRKAGVTVKYYITLISDHGHQDVRKLSSIDEFVKSYKGVQVVEKLWRQIFGQKIAGSAPKDLSPFDLLVASGEGHALLYFPTLVTEGGQTRKVWDKRTPLDLLRHYPYKGEVIDIPAVASSQTAVSFVTARDHTTGAVHVFGAGGEATIEKKVESGRAFYRYKVVKTPDPLSYTTTDKTKGLVDDGFHSAREWQLATVDTDFPDGPVQLHQVFDTERAADIFLSAAPYVSIGDLVDGAKSKSKHGGMTRDESWATLAFHGSGLKPAVIPTARTVDMVPTMLSLMGKEYDPASMDGEAIAEVLAQVQESQERPAAEVDASVRAVEAHLKALEKTSDADLAGWARTFSALLKRPGLKADWVRSMRSQAHDAISRRDGTTAKELVRGEISNEFLSRSREDVAKAAVRSTDPVDSKIVSGCVRDVAQASLNHIFELLETHFEKATDPSSAEGKKALEAIDREIAVLNRLHKAGYDVPMPAFSFATWRNGTNLRLEGLSSSGKVDPATRTALTEFVRIEGARATGIRSILFDGDRARFQSEVGLRLLDLVDTLERPAANEALDLGTLGRDLGPGLTRDLIGDLGVVGSTRAASTSSGSTAAGPSAPASTNTRGQATVTEDGGALDQIYQDLGAQ